jgi:hypothetical protein
MFKLSKPEQVRRDKITAALRSSGEAYNLAVEEYNRLIARAVEVLRIAQHDYNSALSDAEHFVGDFAEDKREEFGEKSEKWQDSDTGSDVSDWLDEWEGVEFNEIELDLPEPMEEIDPSELASQIEDLPEEPG